MPAQAPVVAGWVGNVLRSGPGASSKRIFSMADQGVAGSFVGVFYPHTVGGGPIVPEQPPGIWPSPGVPTHPIAPGGGPSQGPGFPTPPIYIPVPPPSAGGEHPEHPIYIPVYPAHPIVIPMPPLGGAHPEHPIAYPPLVWPPLPTHPIAPGGPPPGVWPSPGHPAHPIAPGGQPPSVWPSPGHPAHPIAPGGGPSQGPGFPTHPIYIPVPQPPDAAFPEHPIYWPVFPSHPIVLPPEGGTPELPPAFVQPPTSAPGFWGYSLYYDSMVFVPYEGGGAPTPTPHG
jgi:hypothetical protein